MRQKGFSPIFLPVFASLFSLQWYTCAGTTCPTGVNCAFSVTNLCGWTSYYNGISSPVNWERSVQGSNGYARLDVTNRNGPLSSYLQSLWIDPQPGYTCQLTFRYHLGGMTFGGTSDCQLSVILEREGVSQSIVWSTRQATGVTALTFLAGTVAFDCQSGTRYQIIFRGDVFGSGNNCGLTPEIAVDDVACSATPTTTTSTTTTTTPPPTTSLADTTYRPTLSVPEETSTCNTCTTLDSSSPASAGVGAGAIAGIVVAGAIVTAAVVIVVVIVVRRRRGLGGKGRGHFQHHYVNTAFGGDLAQRNGESTDGHQRNDPHDNSHHSNDHHDNSLPSNDRPAAAAYQNVSRAAIAANAAVSPSADQTYQNAENNLYEGLATGDVGLRNPYNVLPTQNTYETLARADSHVYKTLTNQNRDADGYEWLPTRKV